jgi:hypothetical protein
MPLSPFVNDSAAVVSAGGDLPAAVWEAMRKVSAHARPPPGPPALFADPCVL